MRFDMLGTFGIYCCGTLWPSQIASTAYQSISAVHACSYWHGSLINNCFEAWLYSYALNNLLSATGMLIYSFMQYTLSLCKLSNFYKVQDNFPATSYDVTA